MVYTYTPTYYTSSTIQDTIASICKSILLPFSLKNRALPADQKLAKKHSEILKWQQESFHKILNLMGLQKEGMVAESEVSAFRTHLLDTLIASPSEQEPVCVIRDKLLFLQELFYAKCISADEYHSSKRPLLQRLAVQGAEIDCKDVIIGNTAAANSEEEWSVIELRDEESPMPAEKSTNKTRNPIKSFINWKGKEKKKDKSSAVSNTTSSILMPESSPVVPPKRKPFSSLKLSTTPDSKERSSKKQWGFEGLKKWKRSGNGEDESSTPYLLFSEERSDEVDSVTCTLVASPIGEGPDTRRIKQKIHSDGSSSDFFIDKVLGDNIKKELSRIKTELSATNPNIHLSDDQMEAISTRLPVEKADLNNFFPKSWCDPYGDIVLGVVKKEFKDHVGEMETLRKNGREKSGDGSEKWVAFEENEENFHPNLFSNANVAGDGKRKDCFVNNPFVDEQNPFWASKN